MDMQCPQYGTPQYDTPFGILIYICSAETGLNKDVMRYMVSLTKCINGFNWENSGPHNTCLFPGSEIYSSLQKKNAELVAAMSMVMSFSIDGILPGAMHYSHFIELHKDSILRLPINLYEKYKYLQEELEAEQNGLRARVSELRSSTVMKENQKALNEIHAKNRQLHYLLDHLLEDHIEIDSHEEVLELRSQITALNREIKLRSAEYLSLKEGVARCYKIVKDLEKSLYAIMRQILQ
jgi:hypothetical protein